MLTPSIKYSCAHLPAETNDKICVLCSSGGLLQLQLLRLQEDGGTTNVQRVNETHCTYQVLRDKRDLES